MRATTALVVLHTVYPNLVRQFKAELTGWEIIGEEQSIGKSGRAWGTIFVLRVEHESNTFPNNIHLPCAGGIAIRQVASISWTMANQPDELPEKVFSCPECNSVRIMRYCPTGSMVVHSCQVCGWTDDLL